ncbi:hypothetical protein L7F22_055150 [Adiantum nelumboides]|nr:hypothetical protein [Adiantum nelumboides]
MGARPGDQAHRLYSNIINLSYPLIGKSAFHVSLLKAYKGDPPQEPVLDDPPEFEGPEEILQPKHIIRHEDKVLRNDFKNWLSAMRGAGMPDSFSWSYKRSYKAGFIWQDVSNDDLVHPLQKNEYVLMGFELQHTYASQGTKLCNCEHYVAEGMKPSRKHMSMESSKLHEFLKEGIMDYLNVSPIKDSSLMKTPTFAKTISCKERKLSCSESFKAENLQTSLAGFSDCDESEPRKMGYLETTAALRVTMASPPLIKQRSGEVKVYKAKEAEQTTDATTQTGESKRCSTEEATSMSVQPHFSSSLFVMASHHHEHGKLLSASSSPLFKPLQNQDVSNNFSLKENMLAELHTSASHDSTLVGSVSTATSNKSDAFYSPSSVHSSCTVLETASPGSARSLRSMNSVSSTRFGANLKLGATMDDQSHGRSSPLGGDYGASSPLKSKRCSNTHLLKQLLSCGSVDISEASILNLKALSLRSVSPGTPFNTSQTGTPTQIAENRLSHSRGEPFHHSQDEDTSPPATPKSWLCRPCGSHSSCLTPFEGQSPSRSNSRLPSRQGSLKDIDVRNIMMTSRSPESVASKKITCPPLLHISPPALNLSCSASPKQTRY